ncbi:hypothetical protein RHECNPAF_1760084 [Rhizobium etli CNPAF512]|nr:hypothetical protein RHECNPAF_1760084 [Rhizobium etli CNPAF512]
MALQFAVGAAHVPDHDRRDGEHDDDGDNSTSAGIAAAAEQPVEHQVRQHHGLPLAVGHGQHDIEDLEDENGDRRPDDGDGAPDLRHHDAPEDLPAIGAIDDGSLDRLFRDAAQRRRQDNHGKTGLDPDQDDHQKEIVPEGNGNPDLRRTAECLHDGVQEADLHIVAAAILVDELPDDGSADEGDRHRHEDDAFGDIAPPDAVSHHGDDQAEEGAGSGHDGEPEDVVEDRLAEFAVVQGPQVIRRADELVARPVVEGQDERRDDRVDEVDDQQEECRAEEQPGADHGAPVQVSRSLTDITVPHRQGEIEELVREKEIGGACKNGSDHDAQSGHNLQQHFVLPLLPCLVSKG